MASTTARRFEGASSGPYPHSIEECLIIMKKPLMGPRTLSLFPLVMGVSGADFRCDERIGRRETHLVT